MASLPTTGSNSASSPDQPNLNPEVSWGAASWPLKEGIDETQGQQTQKRGAGFGQLSQQPLTNIVNGHSRGAWVSIVGAQDPAPSLFQELRPSQPFSRPRTWAPCGHHHSRSQR